jgi:integrase
MAEDIRAWRKASEDARKAGDLGRAQRCTTEAWRLAVALDEQFLAAGRQAWAAKAKAMKAAGERPVDKSKRRTGAPVADAAPCALLDKRHRGARLAERHAERLALLALTGCRPAELMSGVAVTLLRDKQGKPSGVGIEITGAKVDAQRGHEKRRLVFPLGGSGTAVRGLAAACVERGGRYTLTTSPADYRSLNRALQAQGMSCYSFRHAVGGDLKADIADGKTTPEQAAKVMGHRSTASLVSYGTRRRGRGGQRPRVGVSGPVKLAAVTHTARAKARAKNPKAKIALVGAAPSPTIISVAADVPQTPLTLGLRPPSR